MRAGILAGWPGTDAGHRRGRGQRAERPEPAAPLDEPSQVDVGGDQHPVGAVEVPVHRERTFRRLERQLEIAEGNSGVGDGGEGRGTIGRIVPGHLDAAPAAHERFLKACAMQLDDAGVDLRHVAVGIGRRGIGDDL